MKRELRRQLLSVVVKDACSRYGASDLTAVLLPSFQNVVFLVDSPQAPFILRFSESTRRTEGQLLAELQWMEFLRENDVQVPASLPSLQRNLVEKITTVNHESFLVCAFECLRGRSLSRGMCTNDAVHEWGRLAGAIHRLSVRYGASKANLCRPIWYQEENYAVDLYAPPDPAMRQALTSSIEEIRSLPSHPTTYGLIHGDIQPHNMLMMDSGLGIIDFDGSMLSWYIHEVAIALFSVLPLHQRLRERTAFASKFLHTFLTGYSEEHEPDLTLLEHLNSFLQLEELGEYLLALRSDELHRLLAGTGRISIAEWTLALRRREPLIEPLRTDLRPF